MSLDFTTYDGLVDAIAGTLNRTDLDEEIPGWIVLAEENHKSDLRINEMLTRTTTQITARTLAFPTGFVELKRMRFAATSAGYPYDSVQVGSDELTRYYITRTTASFGGQRFPTGRPINMPRYFSADGLFEFDVDPSEYDGYTDPYAQMLYYKAPTALSANNTSNVILARSPGAYFYGALIHSAPYLLDDDRISVWGQTYGAIVAKLNANDRKRGGPLASRVVGPTP